MTDDKNDKMDLTGGPSLVSWYMNIIEFKLRNDISGVAGRFSCSLKEAGDKVKALVDKIVEEDEAGNFMIMKDENERKR